MSLPLQGYTNVKHCILCDFYLSEVDRWTVTNWPAIITPDSTTAPGYVDIQGVNFIPFPLLRGVATVTDSVKNNDTATTVQFAGIDLAFKVDILTAIDNGLNGRPFNLYRAFFDMNNNLITIQGKHFGIINSVAISETWPNKQDENTATMDVTVNLKSLHTLLQTTIPGRYTNPASERYYFPSDSSFDPLPGLINQTIILGATS